MFPPRATINNAKVAARLCSDWQRRTLLSMGGKFTVQIEVFNFQRDNWIP